MLRLILGALGIVLSALIFVAHAHAETRVVDGSGRKVFFDKSGKKLTPLEANRKGEAGEEVLACQYQDYECNSRTGKCALKNAR